MCFHSKRILDNNASYSRISIINIKITMKHLIDENYSFEIVNISQKMEQTSDSYSSIESVIAFKVIKRDASSNLNQNQSNIELLNEEQSFSKVPDSLPLQMDLFSSFNSASLIKLLDSNECHDVFALIMKSNIILPSTDKSFNIVDYFREKFGTSSISTILSFIKETQAQKSVLALCPPYNSIDMKDSIYFELFDLGITQFLYLQNSEISNGGILQRETEKEISQKLTSQESLVLNLHSDGDISIVQQQKPSLNLPKVSAIHLAKRFSILKGCKKSANLTSFKQFSDQITKPGIRGSGLVQRLVNHYNQSDKELMKDGGGAAMKQLNGGGLENEDDEIFVDPQEDPYQQMIQSIAVRKILSHWKMKTKRTKNDSGGGLIIPLRILTAAEEVLVGIFNCLYSFKAERDDRDPQKTTKNKKPKFAILCNQNIRYSQIQTQIETAFSLASGGGNFKMFKSQNSKKQKITFGQPKLWQESLEKYDVFIFMTRNFLDNLIHADFVITDFDYIVFDEVHSCTPPDHQFNQIMTEFYFNSSNYQQSLPYIVGMVGFDNIFNFNEEKNSILAKQMTYSNMLNSEWAVLNKAQAQVLMRMAKTKFESECRFSLQKPFQVHHQIADKLQFMSKLTHNLVIGQGGALVRPHQNIFKLKEISPKLHYNHFQAKLTILESKKILQDFLSEVNTHIAAISKNEIMSGQIIPPVKIIPQYAQIVNTVGSQKLRYFQTRIQLDKLMIEFLNLGHEIIEIWCYGGQDLTRNKENNPKYFIFKKKRESEWHIELQICIRLIQQGYFDQNLLPNEDKICQQLRKMFLTGKEGKKENQSHNQLKQTNSAFKNDSSSQNSPPHKKLETFAVGQQENCGDSSTITKSHYETSQMEQSMRTFSISLQPTDIKFNQAQADIAMLPPLLDSALQIKSQEIKDVSESNPPPTAAEQDRIQNRLEWVKSVTALNQSASQKYKENVALSYNFAVSEIIYQKLEFIILQILNPTFKACGLYEEKARKFQYETNEEEKHNGEYQKYSIRWISYQNNIAIQGAKSYMKTETSNKNFGVGASIFEQDYPIYNKNFTIFRKYSKQIFNGRPEKGKQQANLQSSDHFKRLMNLIDPWVDKIKMPLFMTQHLDVSYYAEETVPALYNRKCLLIMMIIVFTECQPSNFEYNRVKEEMERLEFFGDSVINTAIIMNLFLKFQASLNEKEFDEKKIKLIKSQSLLTKAEDFQISQLLLKGKFQTAPGSSKKSEFQSYLRKLNSVLQGIAGFLGMFVGFSAAYLFLHDVDLVESMVERDKPDVKLETIGEKSVSYKLKVLQELSLQMSKIQDFENVAKKELYKKICEKKLLHPSDSGSQNAFKEKQLLIRKFVEESAFTSNTVNILKREKGEMQYSTRYFEYESPVQSEEDVNYHSDHKQDLISDEFNVVSSDYEQSSIVMMSPSVSTIPPKSKFKPETADSLENAEMQCISSDNFSNQFSNLNIDQNQQDDESKEQVRIIEGYDDAISYSQEDTLISMNCSINNMSRSLSKSEETSPSIFSLPMNASNNETQNSNDLLLSNNVRREREYNFKDKITSCKEIIKYRFKNEAIMMQCFTHRSFSERIAQVVSNVQIDQDTLKLVFDQLKINQKRQAVHTQEDFQVMQKQLTKELIFQFNYQIYEYLGDSILNQTVAKKLYLDTANGLIPTHYQNFASQKLHELKTWFSRNHWIASLFCEHFYSLINNHNHNNSLESGRSMNNVQNNSSQTKSLQGEYLAADKDESMNTSSYLQEQLKPVSFVFAELEQLYSQNEKPSNASVEKILEKFPLIPFLYDDTNSKYTQQLNKYQTTIYRQCYEKLRKSKDQYNIKLPFTIDNFTEPSSKDDDEDDNFQDQQDNFVKLFSDTFEALIGGIFVDSANFEQTQLLIMQLLSTNTQKSFPEKDQVRTKVLSVWASKKYAQQIPLTHTIEERDGFIFVRGFAGKIEIRRVKFAKEKKKKIMKFYLDLSLYLENAYAEFEKQWFPQNFDKNQVEMNKDHWISFNKEFRKKYTPKQSSSSSSYPNQKSILKTAADRDQTV